MPHRGIFNPICAKRDAYQDQCDLVCLTQIQDALAVFQQALVCENSQRKRNAAGWVTYRDANAFGTRVNGQHPARIVILRVF